MFLDYLVVTSNAIPRRRRPWTSNPDRTRRKCSSRLGRIRQPRCSELGCSLHQFHRAQGNLRPEPDCSNIFCRSRGKWGTNLLRPPLVGSLICTGVPRFRRQTSGDQRRSHHHAVPNTMPGRTVTLGIPRNSRYSRSLPGTHVNNISKRNKKAVLYS